MNPPLPRAMAFIDGQNLFNHAKRAFGYDYPNYDVKKLFERICADKGWANASIYFYTGIPDKARDERRHWFWKNKLRAMRSQGIKTESRTLSYYTINGQEVGQEKGIDLRLALNAVRLTHDRAFDVAVIFSQDQDLSEAVKELKRISREQSRPIEIYSAFPARGNASFRRGIAGAKTIKIDQQTYNSCLDPRDYR